eukprot:5313734-Pyramimonas_sp.AAC.1
MCIRDSDSWGAGGVHWLLTARVLLEHLLQRCFGDLNWRLAGGRRAAFGVLRVRRELPAALRSLVLSGGFR